MFVASVMGVSGQETEIVYDLITDRPDATESPNAIPQKSIQIETGAFYESFKEEYSRIETLGYNTTLVRYGLIKNVELRAGWNIEEVRTFVDDEQLENVLSGFSPLLLGMKVEFVQENGILPDIGLLVHLSLPFIASTDYSTETTGVDFRFSFAHTLNEKSSLGYNLGAQWGNDSSEASYLYTLVYGYSITDKLGVYGEVYGDFPENSSANHNSDVGLTYLLQNNIQLDATVGKSFTKEQDILVSVGLSIRIPK